MSTVLFGRNTFLRLSRLLTLCRRSGWKLRGECPLSSRGTPGCNSTGSRSRGLSIGARQGLGGGRKELTLPNCLTFCFWRSQRLGEGPDLTIVGHGASIEPLRATKTIFSEVRVDQSRIILA